MTDKVQKIREEVERIQLYTQSEVLKQVLDYIDEVQKESVSEDLEDAAISYAATGKFLDNGKEMIDFQKEMSFKAGARWQKEKIINKACDWLWEYTFDDNLIKGFRKNMED